jgi:hypothetical protein
MDLFSYIYFPNFDNDIQTLAELANTETWKFTTSNSPDNEILKNYIKYFFKRVHEKNAFETIQGSSREHQCFNTGLLTNNLEEIYATYKQNNNSSGTDWIFIGFCKESDHQMSKFSTLPEMVTFMETLEQLYFNTEKPFRLNTSHIITDNRARFKDPYKSFDDGLLTTIINGAMIKTYKLVKRNYKIAVPQYYNHKFQFLMPLYFSDMTEPDLIITIEDKGDYYYGFTHLTKEMAYKNARIVAKPETDWLNV